MKKIAMMLALLFAAMACFAADNLKIVTPFFTATDVSDDEVSVITDFFISKYAFAMRGKAEIVDRNSFNLLVEEQNFQSKDWASKEGRKQLGMLNATHLIKGQLSRFKNQLVVMIWLIDVETGVVYATYEDSNIGDVSELFNKMADICDYLATQIDGTTAKPITVKKTGGTAVKKDEVKEDEEKFVAKYRVGDTGPGGGWVFFVSEEPFDVFDGKGGVEKCHYLEVSTEELGVMGLFPNKDVYQSTFTNCGLGYGKSNTYKIINTSYSGVPLSAKNSAAYACYEYKTPTTNRGDWFLPSFEELYLLNTAPSHIKWLVYGEDELYWSSSCVLDFNAFWVIKLRYGEPNHYVGYNGKSYHVRAVHAF